MRVDLFYDPVRPATAVHLDGKAVEWDDAYGFLYPVRHCLLQTWLPRSGSWPGLVRQLQDLARGGDLELVFHGRPAEYEDLLHTLGSRFQTSFQPLETGDACRSRIRTLRETLDVVFQKPVLMEHGEVNVYQGAKELFPQELAQWEQIWSAPALPWLREIRCESDFTAARQEQGCCCLVEEPFLGDFHALERLTLLTGSLARADEMILCTVRQPEKRAEFENFAALYPRLPVRFVDAQDTRWRDFLYEKYGLPYKMRLELNRCREGLSILRSCLDRRETLKNKAQTLREQMRHDRPSRYILDLNHCLYQLCWLQEQESRAAQMQSLLEQDFSGLSCADVVPEGRACDVR